MKGRIKRPEATPTRLTLPRIGKIKIGEKSVNRNGKEYPTSTDYFIPSGKYAGLFTQAYGEKPQTIQIVFPEDDAEKVCREEYEYRNRKGELVATGDGEAFKVWNGQKYAEYTTEEYPDIMQRISAKYQNGIAEMGGWKVRLTMNFIIPMVRGIVGVWTFETSGRMSSIPQIRDTFDEIAQRRGSVSGVIFDLNVKFAKSQHPDAASRYPVVTLVPNESEENVRKITEAYKPVKISAENAQKILANQN